MEFTFDELYRWKKDAQERIRFLNTFAIDPAEYDDRIKEQKRIILMADKLLKEVA
jgi:hypothetical protein